LFFGGLSTSAMPRNVGQQAAIQAQVTSKANADKAQQEALEAKARGESSSPKRSRPNKRGPPAPNKS
jgi:hypothetical protein